MLDLKAIEESIDRMIASDTPEEMMEWLVKKRKIESAENSGFINWLCKICFRANICLSYPVLLLFDYLISKTTDKKYGNLRKMSILHFKAVWYKY
jgi:hypothetical protein